MATNGSKLRTRLAQGRIVIAPGVYDMISARIADRMGFDALYMTGYGTVASHLGLPDAGLASYTDMVGRVDTMCSGTTTPLVADADTGYGGLLNVRHTVRGYEKAGAAAVQIEDQEMPKKCGHTTGRRVVPLEDMVAKVRVAVEARGDPDTLIVARTDARTSLGLDEALRRAEAYARAGADLIFVESPESEEELVRIGRAMKGALLVANVVQSGARTPEIPAPQLEEMGFALAIYPSLPHKVVAHALRETYRYLQDNKTAIGLPLPLFSSPEMHALMGFEDVWEFEKRCDTAAGAAP
ncbi:isocitrate lyase/PEP mutase family protein [Ramlibacter sp.]|uniref:isocitrate lyase/PEP mutase family protein n=1 Tax=Ramlibacter sp. TaxID=1917967 RepID=UPI003D118008